MVAGAILNIDTRQVGDAKRKSPEGVYVTGIPLLSISHSPPTMLQIALLTLTTSLCEIPDTRAIITSARIDVPTFEFIFNHADRCSVHGLLNKFDNNCHVSKKDICIKALCTFVIIGLFPRMQSSNSIQFALCSFHYLVVTTTQHVTKMLVTTTHSPTVFLIQTIASNHSYDEYFLIDMRYKYNFQHNILFWGRLIDRMGDSVCAFHFLIKKNIDVCYLEFTVPYFS